MGIYSIHVFFKNSPIPGSPFRIQVGKDFGDPGMVHAYGDGLEKGKTGRCHMCVLLNNMYLILTWLVLSLPIPHRKLCSTVPTKRKWHLQYPCILQGCPNSRQSFQNPSWSGFRRSRHGKRVRRRFRKRHNW